MGDIRVLAAKDIYLQHLETLTRGGSAEINGET